MRLVGDGIELLLAVAVGGMLFSALVRLARGQLRVARCPGCGRCVSHGLQHCRYCGMPVNGGQQ